MAYDRYKKYRVDGTVKLMNMVKIPQKSTDFFETYIKGKTRLDLLSYDYYGDAGYDWLILMANPSLPALEYQIPNGTVLRIPYPLSITLEQYNSQIDRLETINGLN